MKYTKYSEEFTKLNLIELIAREVPYYLELRPRSCPYLLEAHLRSALQQT